MRHPKRFCIQCNKLQALTVRKYNRYSMYHCRSCGDEICRMGDGSQAHAPLQIRNGVDARSMSEDVRDSLPLTDLACSNPDVLSDDHRLWLEEEWYDGTRTWKQTVTLALLTPRQQEVVKAVQQHSGQGAAAKALGITQQAVSRIMHQIRKKLEADGCISDKLPLE